MALGTTFGTLGQGLAVDGVLYKVAKVGNEGTQLLQVCLQELLPLGCELAAASLRGGRGREWFGGVFS